MRIRSAALVALVLLTAVAGCAIPRGAGLESEVLSARKVDREGEPMADLPPDFAVFSVTRDTLSAIDGWPVTGGSGLGWIRRQQQAASMIIAAGDRMSITVWDAEENSLLASPGQRVTQMTDVQVSSGGVIFLPFVGDMRVAGMSPQTAREKIQERYATTIPSVQVQVAVQPGRANTADLVAGVASPGVYPLADRDVTLLSLLSLGGGVLPGLVNPQVRLMRGGKVYATSLGRLYADPSLDTTLVGGDRVIVEEETRVFLSLGATGNEARHLFPKDQLSALEALTIVGGVNDARANPKGVLILREYPPAAVSAVLAKGPPQGRMIFTLDLTSADGLFSAGRFRILPGDLVYATESPVTAAQTVLGLVGNLFGTAARL